MDTRFDFVLRCPDHDHTGLMQAAEHFAGSLNLSAADCFRLLLIVDELVSNSLRHGALLHDGQTLVRVSITDLGTELAIEIIDSGMPFDPTAHPTSPYDGQDAPKVGGMGLCLIKQLACSLQHWRLDEHNHIRVTLSKEPKENRCCSAK